MKKRTFVVVMTLVALSIIGVIIALSLQKKEGQNPTPQSPRQESAKPADATKDWKKYTYASGAFSFKYPASWSIKDKSGGCSIDVIALAAEASALSNCQAGAAGDPGQIWMTYKRGNLDSMYRLEEGNGVIDVTTTQVTIADTRGIRQVGIGQNPNNQSSGFPDGGKVVRYILMREGYTFQATYNQKSDYPDSIEDFEKLITQTLAFARD